MSIINTENKLVTEKYSAINKNQLLNLCKTANKKSRERSYSRDLKVCLNYAVTGSYLSEESILFMITSGFASPPITISKTEGV